MMTEGTIKILMSHTNAVKTIEFAKATDGQ